MEGETSFICKSISSNLGIKNEITVILFITRLSSILSVSNKGIAEGLVDFQMNPFLSSSSTFLSKFSLLNSFDPVMY